MLFIFKSLYIYCHEIEKQDMLIPKLAELMEKETDLWFFIRYWEGGPHIRLRFVDKNDLKHKVWDLCDDFFQNHQVTSVDRDLFYSRNSFDGKDIDPQTLPWYESNTIIEKPYIPEIERYGDGELLHLSEEIFYLSSNMVARVIRQSSQFNSRLYASIYMLVHLLHDLDYLDYDFLDRYQAYWKTLAVNKAKVANQRVLFNIIGTVLRGEKRNELLDYYIQKMLSVFSKIKKLTENHELAYILTSQLHMTNNRLSVTPELEYLLSKNVRDYIGKMEEKSTELS
ncbi:MAG TPA: thiopeptide-type bacteriocin biosynthesis protein [Bacillota bacterium]|nr:thiopeptide-type bacteriocin biosynthesis protein [Bacillota bacterium]